MQLGMAVAPVRMMAVGKQVMPNNTVTPFSHTYDFFNFEPNVDPYYFEVFCWYVLRVSLSYLRYVILPK